MIGRQINPILHEQEVIIRSRLYSEVRSIVSSPGRDSRDLRSSRLAEATQKALGTNAL